MCGDNFVSDGRTAAALAGEPTAQERLAHDGWSYVLAAAQHLDPPVMPFLAAEDRDDGDPFAGVAWIRAVGDPARVLPLGERNLERVGVEALIAELGPVARGFAGAMEQRVSSFVVPTRLTAPTVMWRITGDAERAFDPLAEHATSSHASIKFPSENVSVAALDVEMGPASGPSCSRLVELASGTSRLLPSIRYASSGTTKRSSTRREAHRSDRRRVTTPLSCGSALDHLRRLDPS